MLKHALRILHVERFPYADKHSCLAHTSTVPLQPSLRARGYETTLRIAYTSGRSGGAILASGVVSLDYCVFAGNQAGLGSAVTSTVSVRFYFVDFINNTLLCDDSTHFLDWNDVSGLE